MEKRLAALEDIQAPEHLRSIRFRQSSALELHNKFPDYGRWSELKIW